MDYVWRVLLTQFDDVVGISKIFLSSMKTMFFGSPLEASRCRRLEPECLDDLERFEPEFELELEPIPALNVNDSNE